MSKKEVEQTVMLKALKRQTEISHDGETYKVDKDGFVEVPVSIAALMESHGFREATEDDIKPKGK